MPQVLEKSIEQDRVRLEKIWTQTVNKEIEAAKEADREFQFIEQQRQVLGHQDDNESLSTTAKRLLKQLEQKEQEDRLHSLEGLAGHTVSPTRTQSTLNQTFGSTAPPADKYEYALYRTLSPKDRYGKPVLESHKYGWRPSLERFGVNQYGQKRVDKNEIMPARRTGASH
eukprot:GILJ01000787.1.p1 GENE.GILJ01000787.1~~GILJ01000787.1.p1  ORF type:complete len:170 (+),score=25.46 GILJ01000787.1:82-591(+)